LLHVKGWAFCKSGIASVQVHLDNIDLGSAELGEERPDVAGAFPDIAVARTSGFRFTGHVGKACEGDYMLRLIAAGCNGERHEAELPVRAEGRDAVLDATGAPQAGIRCFLDQPVVKDGRASEAVRGFLSLAGWAFSAAGLTSIEVFVDGRSQGQAHRGIRREDLHDVLGVKEALNAGFAMLIPPQVMKRGTHVVRVVISDAAGEVQEIAFSVTSEPSLDGAGPWSLRRKLTQAEIDLQTRVLDACGSRPVFTLLLAGAGQKRGLRTTVESLRMQAWTEWSLAVPGMALPDELAPIAERVRLLPNDPAIRLADLLADSAPALLGVLGPGDELGEDALLELAVESALDRRADFLYGDERRFDPGDGELRAFFKPDFAPDLLLSTNYIGRPWVAARMLLERTGATLGDIARRGEYDLVLRLTEQATAIRHVPKVLCARAARALDSPAREQRALRRALIRRGTNADVLPGCIAGTWRVRRSAPAGLVSIIIPTVGARGLVRTAIESIRVHTDRARIQLVVIDNISPDAPADQRRWKPWLRVHADTVVETSESFNWSRFNNQGALHAKGDFLLFLNDDVEVLEDGWLDALLEHAGRPEVGAVGPLLLYPDGKVQHAGQFLAGSAGRHAFRFSPADQPGPFGLALTQRDVISVTGACLLTRRDVFERLGGFDEQHPIINNDVDFCLRVRARGLAVIYTPHARLTHHEMASRAGLSDRFDTARFRAAWADLLATGDPFYSPHLAPDADDYMPEQEPLKAQTIGHPVIAAEKVQRILAVKLDHIGDFIAAFPAFRRIKQAFPNAELTVLCAEASLTLATLEPAIDRALRFDFFHAVSEHGRLSLRERDFAQLARQLAPYRFDLAIDLRRQPDTRPVLQATGARWLAGFDQNNAWRFLDIAVEWEGDKARTRKRVHVSEALVALVDAVASACATERQLVQLPAQSDARATAASLPALAGLNITRPLVAIHAGAGAENKQWPAENFAALIDVMTSEADIDIILIGGPGEARIAEAVLAAVRRHDRVFSVVGRLALHELSVLLRACALYVGNDSGPKHLAAGLGVPTVGIHSGSVDATEWGPLGPAAMAIRREVTCSPCYLAHARDCHRGLACLRGIRVGDVWRVARRLLALRLPSADLG
jgi:ADP-heptose:LPS heptosyltransferase/GT2 family glycosyltransferase